MQEYIETPAQQNHPAAANDADDYLAPLKEQQRLAVEHGVGIPGPTDGAPLLVIAGAGSGKTNTLAYRVAHLVSSGADHSASSVSSFFATSSPQRAIHRDRFSRPLAF